MTKKEKILELKEIVKRKKAFIRKYKNDDEISEKLKSEIIKDFNQEIAELEELINFFEQSGKTEKRTEASKKATEARSKKAKEKIQNAINLLRMEGKEITAYSISKVSGVHYNTVKKYLDTEEIRK